MNSDPIPCEGCGRPINEAGSWFRTVLCSECWNKLDSFSCPDYAGEMNVPGTAKPYHSVRTFHAQFAGLWLREKGASAINQRWQNTKIWFGGPHEDYKEKGTFWFQTPGSGAEHGQVGPFRESEIRELSVEINEDGCSSGQCWLINIMLSGGTIGLEYKPPFRFRSSYQSKSLRFLSSFRFDRIRHHEKFSYIPSPQDPPDLARQTAV